MSRSQNPPKRKTVNKPSFDYQLDENDEIQEAADLEGSVPQSFDLSNPESRKQTERDPYYQVYHKPAVKHPGVLLLLCILTLCVSIANIALDAVIVHDVELGIYLGTAVWCGPIGIIASGVGMVFLHFQTNCFAIVVLNIDMVAFCFNSFCAFYDFFLAALMQEGTITSTAQPQLIGIGSLCLVCVGLIVAHFVLMSMATCTRFKRKAASSKASGP